MVIGTISILLVLLIGSVTVLIELRQTTFTKMLKRIDEQEKKMNDLIQKIEKK